MELYNSIIRKVEELAGSSTPRRCPYDPQGAWEDTGSFELVMLRDAAYELGGSSKPAVNFTCVTTSAQLVVRDVNQILIKQECKVHVYVRQPRQIICHVGIGLLPY